MGRGAVTFVALLSSLAACSLFTELGGLDKAAESDAAAPDGNASSSSGSSSGGNDDGSTPPSDAGVSDGDATSDGAIVPCAARTDLDFCADFDDVASPEEGWTKPYGGLPLALDTAQRISLPQSLKVQASALEAGANAQGALEITLNGTRSAITASVDVYVEDPKPMNGGLLVVFALYLATNYDVYIQIDPTKTVLMEKLAAGVTSYQTHDLTPFPLGKWVHLDLIYETAGGAKLTLRQTVVGAAPDESTFSLSLAPGATAGTYGVRAGIPYVGGVTSAANVWTDNVTLASKP